MSNHLPGLELWEGILEQCAIRLLFCLLLFRRRFSVDLSHQIIENLTGERVQSIFFLKKNQQQHRNSIIESFYQWNITCICIISKYTMSYLRLYDCNFNILQDPSNGSLQSCDQKTYISDNN